MFFFFFSERGVKKLVKTFTYSGSVIFFLCFIFFFFFGKRGSQRFNYTEGEEKRVEKNAP